MSGEEAERSSAVTRWKFLGRSGPAHNSVVSQQLLVSLPLFPLGQSRQFEASGAPLASGIIDKICAFNSYHFPLILFTKIILPLLARPHNAPASCLTTGRHNTSFFIENGFRSAAVWRYPLPCTFFPSDSLKQSDGKRKPTRHHTCQTNPGDLAPTSRPTDLKYGAVETQGASEQHPPTHVIWSSLRKAALCLALQITQGIFWVPK